MSRPIVASARMLLVVFVVGACSTAQQRLAEASPARGESTAMFLQASQEAGAGRYGVADKLLADYSARYPGSADAADAMYWRALYKLDPANQSAAPRDALVLLDSYLSTIATDHRPEAQTLRRVAAALEARAAAAATAAVPPKVDPPKAEDKAKDEELQRVRDELAKANAELERIKRRLAQPKP